MILFEYVSERLDRDGGGNFTNGSAIEPLTGVHICDDSFAT